MNRVFSLNKTAITRFFVNWEELLEKHNFPLDRIYNCDESGLTCVHKPLKVISLKGKRVISSVTSSERGQTTTVLLAMNAVGHYVPPKIFKRKRMKESLIDEHQMEHSVYIQKRLDRDRYEKSVNIMTKSY